jgi:molybdopterin molybdotransferase
MDDIIVARGCEILPHHVMAMASVGIDAVCVQRRIQATVITTGCELQETGPWMPNVTSTRLADCNGPFLCASLRSLGILVKCITGVSDDIHELQDEFTKAVASCNCDILITTGGVSAGKFDFVPEAMLNLGGSMNFHHVAMRPGHPVLFASLPTRVGDGLERDVPLFGLPGNPIAAAACYRFLVVPYLRALLGQKSEVPMWDKKISAEKCTLANSPLAHGIQDDSIVYQKDKKLDAFRHAQMCGDRVVMSSEQSPGKVRPFAYASCWVHVRAGISELRVGDAVECYPLNSITAFALGGES